MKAKELLDAMDFSSVSGELTQREIEVEIVGSNRKT
jgi:hypothetical protein